MSGICGVFDRAVMAARKQVFGFFVRVNYEICLAPFGRWTLKDFSP
jgi:hypothetical protein